jgi:hypothetical protein
VWWARIYRRIGHPRGPSVFFDRDVAHCATFARANAEHERALISDALRSMKPINGAPSQKTFDRTSMRSGSIWTKLIGMSRKRGYLLVFSVRGTWV